MKYSDRYRNYFNYCSDAFFILDDEGFIDCNNATLQLFGYDSKDELLSLHPSSISPKFQPDGRLSVDKANEMIGKAIETGSHRFDWIHTKIDGTEFDAEVVLTHIPENGKSLIHATCRDISDRKSIEKKLDIYRENLEQTVQIRTKELRSAYESKSNFLSSMSHELRTPMNAILGFAQLLELTSLSDFQKSSVEQILSGGNHLLELINDVLELSKIEAGKIQLTFKNFDLEKLINECVQLISDLTLQRNISIKIDLDYPLSLMVRADCLRLKQVLLNLLSNAVKYNKDGGTIEISTKLITAEIIRVSVTDTGIGIPFERQSELFQPFNRIGAENSDIEGTGIGLTLSEKLVKKMGGEIGFESKESKGSLFWFTIPLAQEKTINHEPKKAIANQNNLPNIQGTVLYIEDNPSNIKLMESLISNIDGLNLLVAKTAEEGITIAKTKKPDVIITDINLPGMNGNEALAQLRQFKETQKINVIALSANASAEDIQAGLGSGFYNYLTKPVQITEVVNVLKSAISVSN